jgi:hypothetical protein
MGIVYNTSIVRDGLVLHLDAANVKSYPGTGTAWNDLSGNGNNGILTNGPTYIPNGYLNFDGVNDGFNAPITCNKMYYSIDWWFYPRTTINYNQNIRFDGGWNSFVWHTGTAGQYWAGTDISTRMSDVDAGSVVINKWQNWTWTFDNGTAKMYKNGILLRQKTMAVSSVSQFTSINSSSDGNGMNGYRSSILVYSNKVLSQAEVRQNFEALRGRYGI